MKKNTNTISAQGFDLVMKKKHRARRLLCDQDNINTDYVISGRYKFRIQDPKELAQHIFEDVDQTFVKRLKTGDILVAGDNFGCGSSREQAPLAISSSGIQGVIANSFARIFYRNAVNIGLPVVECDTRQIDDGDEILLDFDASQVRNVTKSVTIRMIPLPNVMKTLLADGGVVAHFRKHKGFNIETV